MPSQYLTVAELVEGPTGVDYRSLPSRQQNTPAGVTMTENYQKVTDLIQKASGAADAYCNQVLGATLDSEEKWTETFGAGVDANGYLWVRPDNFPVISVLSFQWGLPAIGGTAWQTVTLTDLVVTGDLRGMVVYPGMFDRRARPPYRVQYTYLNGYPTTTLTATTAAGATTLPVADATGIVAGGRLTLYDGGNTEVVTVASTWVATQGAAGVALAAGTRYAHTPTFAPFSPSNEPYDVSVSALPQEVKFAVMLICKYMAEVRGSSALILPGTKSSKKGEVDEVPMEAREILDKYARVF